MQALATEAIPPMLVTDYFGDEISPFSQAGLDSDPLIL
jgi:hypothetical protein